MPIYCFEKKSDGEVVELFLEVSEMEAMKVRGSDVNFKLDDGELATLHYGEMHCKTSYTPDLWRNHESDSAGVHPDQVEEKMAENARRGISVEYTKDGRAKFTSQAHRRRYMKAYGLVDRNSFV